MGLNYFQFPPDLWWVQMCVLRGTSPPIPRVCTPHFHYVFLPQVILASIAVFTCISVLLRYTVPPISPLIAVHSSFTANSNEHDYAHENIVYSVPMCFSVICYPAYVQLYNSCQ